MDYEKLYNAALERAKKNYITAQDLCEGAQIGVECFKNTLESIFPELAESEDEKNIKDLIDELKCSLRAANCQNDACRGGHEKRIALLEWAIAWLEKQGKQKSKDRYTFKSIPRLLEMIKPTDRAKAYCKKLIDSLLQEGYATDAKIVNDCLKQMNGEKVAMAVMDIEKQGESDETKAKMFLISKGYPIDTNGIFPTYEEMYNIIREGLEKQGVTSKKVTCTQEVEIGNGNIKAFVTEEMPTDTVEPKFHEGDWIIANNKKSAYQVIEVKRGIYAIRDNADNHEYHIGIEEAEKSGRLWTIQDARDGDVLTSELCDSIILFRGIKDDNIDFYCDYDFSKIDIPGDRFTVNNGQHYGNVLDSKDFHPATKKQRDLLFQKMKESGYMWDEKRTLC